MTKPDDELTYKDIEIGAMATEPGNASQYRTGDWRSQRTTYEYSRSIKCGICSLFCPEGCVRQREDGLFEADLYYCKGCGICAQECPTGVIAMVEEVED